MIDQYPGAEEVYYDEYYSLYRSLKGGSGVPIFIIPPFAGRKGRVVLPLIKKCEKTGRPVWWYELKNATQATKNLDVNQQISLQIAARPTKSTSSVAVKAAGWRHCSSRFTLSGSASWRRLLPQLI